VYLRSGIRVEANPLGAPDRGHVSLSVGAYEGKEPAIPRSRIDYIAAQTTVPPGGVCADLVVRRDRRRTSGAVTLGRIIYSEGVIRQRGVEIDLRDVAYIKFARRPGKGCRPSR